jgi:hypothetical protein
VSGPNYQSPRGLDRALFLKLAACDWIAERRNLLLTGASGHGKSWLACALGHKACRQNLSVLYTRMPRLFVDLAIAHGDARYARLLRSLARVKLLILDDWGPEALTPDQARDPLEIVEDRYDKGSLIITSQVPVDRWHDLIGSPRSPTPSSTASFTTPIASIWPARTCAAVALVLKSIPRGKAGSPDPRRNKAVDNGGVRYGAMESALRPPLPTATRTLAEIQIQAHLTNPPKRNIIPSIRGSRRRVAGIKSESRPASNRNRWPASYWNAWPASSETADYPKTTRNEFKLDSFLP